MEAFTDAFGLGGLGTRYGSDDVLHCHIQTDTCAIDDWRKIRCLDR
jgi:hypothetical protein